MSKRELAIKIWDIMGRASIFTDEVSGDATHVEVDISDWREICELLFQAKSNA